MHIAALFVSSKNIVCSCTATSKKKVIEKLSSLLATNIPYDPEKDEDSAVTADNIYKALLERERLGSTGLGRGVALPHARIANIDHTIAAMMLIKTPVDFATNDDQKVDIVIGLLVPDNEDDAHLENLSLLVTQFRKDDLCAQIREATDSEQIFDLLLTLNDD